MRTIREVRLREAQPAVPNQLSSALSYGDPAPASDGSTVHYERVANGTDQQIEATSALLGLPLY